MNTSFNLMPSAAPPDDQLNRTSEKKVLIEREAARERQEHPNEYAINFHINVRNTESTFEPVLFLFVSNLFNFRLFFWVKIRFFGSCMRCCRLETLFFSSIR